ncbi:MAG: hypothetical protein PHX62_05990, partial [Bacilli bacterium]|nr:hypothetical protein [Bacilli bacterium]
MKSIGIDIGTTSITLLLIEDEKLLEVKTFNHSFLKSNRNFEKIQDPTAIYDIVIHQMEYFFSHYADIGSIGVTGQMHG